MISKKKVTALALAGLFVTPVLADTYVPNNNSIQSGDGYLTADDDLFSQALKNSRNRTDSGKNAVKLTMWGKHNDSNKDGLTELKLSGKTYDNVNYILFADNSGQDNAIHRSSFNLDETTLTLSKGVIFRNASNFIERNGDGSFDENKRKQLKNESVLNLSQSTLTGAVINQFDTFGESSSNYFQISLGNNTEVVLNDSQWTGDLKDEVNLNGNSLGKPVDKSEAASKNVISLTDGSSWIGGVDVTAKSTVDVTLDGTSSWTVTKNSRVNSIGLAPSESRQAAKNSGVTIGNGVTLTIAEGSSASTISSLQTGTGSSLEVESAQVTINSIGGSGTVQLNKNGVVTIEAASDDVNATLTSLEGSKLTTAEDVSASVTIAGALADEMGMDAVIKAYNDRKNYAGNGKVTFSGGLIGDDLIGRNDENGVFVQESSRKNTQLVSIGEGTAITMMQWRADADDMAQRMGDLRSGDGTAGAWVRTFGGKAEAGYVDNKYYGIQAGVDALIGTGGTKQFAGGALSFATGDADFANGTGENYIGTLTGYSTWLFENGAYIDVTAKWGKLHNEFDLAVDTRKLSGRYNTQALALTVESGHRFPLSRLTYVEPQVAFTASHIFGEDYGASEGVTVEQDSINSYVARVGLQAGVNCPNNMGAFFVRASYLYDLDGKTSTTARMANAKDANRFDQDFGGGWYEFGLGMNVNFTKNLYGYADFEYVTGGEIETPYRWNAGVRYAF